uniref:Uncharacterized protein n=1 Tax=Myripristis murdjan TaxID=586833 RepID=A0A667XQ93_9TELE
QTFLEPLFSFFSALSLLDSMIHLQVRNPTSACGRAAHTSATSPALTTWLCTRNATSWCETHTHTYRQGVRTPPHNLKEARWWMQCGTVPL